MKFFDAKKMLEEHMEMCQAMYDALVLADDVAKMNNCNNCGTGQPGECKYLPRLGETVRFNCPLWEGGKK